MKRRKGEILKKLFSSTPQGAGAGGQEKRRGSGGLSVARLNLIPLLVAVLIILASGYLAYLQFVSQVTARQEEEHAAIVRELAARLGGRLEARAEQLERLAQADATLQAAIAEGDETLLREREAGLSEMFPTALRIRYILPSEQDPDTTLTPQLSYACLELARDAERGRRPPFEVHLYGDAQQHLDMVRAVRDGTIAKASLMVTLDVSVLKTWLEGLKPMQGYLELQQGSGRDALSLFTVGDAALKGQGAAYQARIALSGWYLNYYPGVSLGMAEAQRLGFLAIFAVAAAGLTAFFVLFNRSLSGFLHGDLKRLVGFIVDSSLGKRFYSYPVKLAESKRVLQEKEVELSVLSSHASIKEGPSAGHGSHEEASIPDITFLSDDALSVGEAGEGKGSVKPKGSTRQEKS